MNPSSDNSLTETDMQALSIIGERLKTQDNRITQNPMFCVQVQVADCGYDTAYADDYCWWNAEQCEIVYDDAPEGWDEYGDHNGWEQFGYKKRWETVMVAFTEAGLLQYLELNGHNDRRRAHKGEVRIYAESFNRCPEMISIREALMRLPAPISTPT